MGDLLVKPGVKTSEFWVALLGGLATAVPSVAAALNGRPWVAAILGGCAVVLPAVYIWGRAVLKSEREKSTDIIPDGWEDTLDRVLSIAEALAKAGQKEPE